MIRILDSSLDSSTSFRVQLLDRHTDLISFTGTLALSLRILVLYCPYRRGGFPKVVDHHLTTFLAQTIRIVDPIIFLPLYVRSRINYGT